MNYQVTFDAMAETSTIIRLEDGAFIPADPNNADYKTYQEWLSEGNAPTSVGNSLDDLKIAKLTNLQRQKALSLGSMQYLDHTVTLTTRDQVDVSTQMTLLAGQPSGTTIQWEIVNNVFVTWQISDLQALETAGITHVMSTYANTSVLAGQINTAADQATLAAIDLTQGWPV